MPRHASAHLEQLPHNLIEHSALDVNEILQKHLWRSRSRVTSERRSKPRKNGSHDAQTDPRARNIFNASTAVENAPGVLRASHADRCSATQTAMRRRSAKSLTIGTRRRSSSRRGPHSHSQIADSCPRKLSRPNGSHVTTDQDRLRTALWRSGAEGSGQPEAHDG